MTRHREFSTERIRWVLKPLLTAVILGAVAMMAVSYWSMGKETWPLLLLFDRRFLLLALGLVGTAWICNGLRLKLLAGSLGHPLPLWRATQVSLVGEFGIGAFPAGSGMLVLRVFLLRQLGIPAGTTLSMLATDGVMDFIFFTSILPLALWPILRGSAEVPHRLGTLVLVFFALVGVAIATGFALRRRHRRPRRKPRVPLGQLPRWRRRLRARLRMFHRRLTHLLMEFRQGLHTLLRLRRRTLVIVFLVVIVQWCCRYGVLPVLLWGFGRPVNPFPLFALQGLLFTLALVMVVPGGSGGVEMVFAVVMAPVIPKELIGPVLILWRFFTYYLYILSGGALFAAVPYTFPKRKIGAKR